MKSSTSPISLTVDKNFDDSYTTSGKEWLPGRAEIDVRLDADSAETGAQFNELELEVKSGPAALYRYFPFSAFIYVDDRAAAVLEFSKPQEELSVTIEVPASRTFRLTVVSELSQRLGKNQPEPRDRALQLIAMRPGRTVPPPEYTASTVAPAADHFSHQRVALVDELPEPIFIVGPYRSGTSILTWALGQHPDIWPLPETLWVPHLGTGAVAGYWIGARPPRNYFGICDVTIEEYLAHVGSSIDDFIKRTTLRRMNRMNFERLHPKPGLNGSTNEAFELARTLFSRKRRWVDGTPENAGNMSLLIRLFPAAKFICTVRDPIDVIASMAHFEKAGGNRASIKEAADMWRRMSEWTLEAGRALGSNVVKFVSYTELTASPLSATSQIFDFLNEPRAPKSADAYAHRINSSNVSVEERELLRPEIQRYIETTEIPAIYAEISKFIGATWQADPQARKRLDTKHNVLVMETLKAALPELELDIP